MTLSRKDLLKDILSVVEHSRNQVKFHRTDIQSQEKFLDALKQIIDLEAPEFREKFAEIQQKYLAVLEKEKLLAGAEERAAEDINDITARFDVIFRLSEESAAAKRKVNDCRTRIEKLRKDLEIDEMKGGTKKYKIEGDINRAIEAKKVAIEQAEDKLLEFIEMKEKYTVFKVNRLQHAYQHLGSIMSSSMREQSEDCEKLTSVLNEAQEQIDEILEAGPSAPVEDAPAAETQEE